MLIGRLDMNRFWVIVVSIVLFVSGVFVVFSSVGWGSEAANAYLRSQGGGMDGSQFMIVFQEYIEIYRWIGGILSIVGGLGLVRAIEVR
jgi:hypothetical protein